MARNQNFTGSIEVLSGLKPAGKGQFPLIEAEDVLMPNGKRLSDPSFNGGGSGGGASIADESISQDYTWSSSKIDSELDKKADKEELDEYVKTVNGQTPVGGNVTIEIPTDGSSIDDKNTSTETTWSSSKINSELANKANKTDLNGYIKTVNGITPTNGNIEVINDKTVNSTTTWSSQFLDNKLTSLPKDWVRFNCSFDPTSGNLVLENNKTYQDIKQVLLENKIPYLYFQQNDIGLMAPFSSYGYSGENEMYFALLTSSDRLISIQISQSDEPIKVYENAILLRTQLIQEIIGSSIADTAPSGQAVAFYVQQEIDNFSKTMIGQATTDSGEIFNDYEKNKAIGKLSHAEGSNSQAGVYGYYVKSIQIAEDGSGIIYLTNKETTPVWGDDSYYISDNGISIANNIIDNYFSVQANSYFQWPRAAKITNVNEKGGIVYEGTITSGKDFWETGKDNGTMKATPFIFYVDDLLTEGAVTIGHSAHAEGLNTLAAADQSHAEGEGTKAIGRYGHSEGVATVAGYAAHAEGLCSVALGLHSHSEGYTNESLGKDSHSEGRLTKAHGEQAHTEGLSTIASGNFGSHAEGNTTRATNNGSHAEGLKTEASGKYSHAEGYETTASGNFGSHAEGNSTEATNNGAHAEGRNTEASGMYSHAEGDETRATKSGAHAEGYRTQAQGVYSHAEGVESQAKGTGSHAEGRNTEASGMYSHAEGDETRATESGAHAEGGESKAVGVYSHSEGYGTTASSNQAHAEGNYTVASGMHSHAEGGRIAETDSTTLGDHRHRLTQGTTVMVQGSKAQGRGSHAENIQTLAYGYASHAEGYRTLAEGNYSHAEGLGTIANGTAQHVSGKYNKKNNEAIFIIGDGTEDSPHNALEIIPRNTSDDTNASVLVMSHTYSNYDNEASATWDSGTRKISIQPGYINLSLNETSIGQDSGEEYKSNDNLILSSSYIQYNGKYYSWEKVINGVTKQDIDNKPSVQIIRIEEDEA